MANVPVGPQRVTHSAPQGEEANETFSVAASSRSAGNSFKTAGRGREEKSGLPKLKLIGIIVKSGTVKISKATVAASKSKLGEAFDWARAKWSTAGSE